MFCIVLVRPDGSITIAYPANGDTSPDAIATAKAAQVARLATKYGGVSVAHDYDTDLLPESDCRGDEPFCDCWEWVDDAVQVHMPTARGVHMDTIRVVRNAELAKEDINMLRAIEAGDASEQSAVATKKQTLRDIPANFDITTDAGTPELLKAKWPSELPDRE
jgi:hypothetical protein